jgi:hypothetical protein
MGNYTVGYGGAATQAAATATGRIARDCTVTDGFTGCQASTIVVSSFVGIYQAIRNMSFTPVESAAGFARDIISDGAVADAPVTITKPSASRLEHFMVGVVGAYIAISDSTIAVI